jgi:hypothetical protein
MAPHKHHNRKFVQAAEDSPGRWRQFLRGFFYLMLIVFVAVSTYTLLYASFMSVDSISVEGVQRIPGEDLKELILSQVEGQNFMRMPRNNLMMINSHMLERSILEQYPQISSVAIAKQFPHSLQVKVEEHVRIVVLCEYGGLSPHVDSFGSAQCIEVNSRGQYVQRVDFAHSRYTVNPVFRINANALNIQDLDDAGDDILVEESILTTLIALQEKFPFTIDTQLAGEPLLMFFGSGHARLQTDEGWDVLVDARSDPRITLAVLKAFFAQSEEKNVRRRVTEVDVRVVGKVFYKLEDQDEVIEESIDGVDELEN